MSDVEQIVAPAIPASMIQLSELLAKEVSEISGVNEENLGANTEEVAGVLSALRQGAGLTTLQILFDQLDRSCALLGKLMIDIIQANFTPGKIQKILENEQPADQFYNKAFGRYHAVVEEGLNTITQRQMQFAQMLQLKEAGVPISTSDLLEAATIQGKDKIIANAIKQEQQAQQVQQMQLQAAIQEQEARTNLAHARATADEGLGLERMSRIQENQALAVERRSQAHRDDESAILEKVKALKELETIDIGHLNQLLQMANAIRAAENPAPVGENPAPKVKKRSKPAQSGSAKVVRGETL